MKVLFYTFRSCSFKDRIPNAFVFGSLKSDFLIFARKVLSEHPDLIIGIAKGNVSVYEPKAINSFNKTKMINKTGVTSYALSILDMPKFPVSKFASDSFCNWTMYKVSELIAKNNLNTKLVFIHLNEKDLSLALSSLP